MIRKTYEYKCEDYGILDVFNGYKFALTYHILEKDNITPYFYYGHGGKVFDLDDIEWLWPRFFVDINDKTQKLDQYILNMINGIGIKRECQLYDIEFDEFIKQCQYFPYIY